MRNKPWEEQLGLCRELAFIQGASKYLSHLAECIRCDRGLDACCMTATSLHMCLTVT